MGGLRDALSACEPRAAEADRHRRLRLDGGGTRQAAEHPRPRAWSTTRSWLVDDSHEASALSATTDMASSSTRGVLGQSGAWCAGALGKGPGRRGRRGVASSRRRDAFRRCRCRLLTTSYCWTRRYTAGRATQGLSASVPVITSTLAERTPKCSTTPRPIVADDADTIANRRRARRACSRASVEDVRQLDEDPPPSRRRRR